MALPEFNTFSVATGLGRLNVKTVGTGQPVLFWPSLMMSSDMWLGIAERLHQSYQLIFADPPGQGDSELLDRRFELADSAECLPAILDAVSVARAHYVGNSWGGMIGGTFAARHPDRIGAAVLMNCTAAPAGLKQKLEYQTLVQTIRALGYFPGFINKTAVKAFLGPTSEREQPRLIAYIEGALKRLDARSVSYAVESVVPRRPDQTPLFAGIKTPVLVVAGDEDRTFALAETKAMAEAIPGAQFNVMSGVAHLAGLEQPERTAALIHDFIGRHPLR